MHRRLCKPCIWCCCYALLCGSGSLWLRLLPLLTPSGAWMPSPTAQNRRLFERSKNHGGDIVRDQFQRTRGHLLASSESNGAATSSPSPSTQPKTILQSYEYDGWNLTYRTMAQNAKATSDEEPPASSSSNNHNILLIHPVGVGLASWFWEPLLESLQQKTSGNINAYAPNLIGCGISEGSDAWNPRERGMFVPLGWVKMCEAFMNHIENEDETTTEPQTWTVVSQGGLAPIGVLVAARNPSRVDKLVLASPPLWNEMAEGYAPDEVKRNYDFLTNPIVEKLAFGLLETRGLIRFFSNRFLFHNDCDEAWLDKTDAELCPEARPPVCAFNSGLVLNTGLATELTRRLTMPVTVVQGEHDLRERPEYTTGIPGSTLVVVPEAQNVVPWEVPGAFADLLLGEIGSNNNNNDDDVR